MYIVFIDESGQPGGFDKEKNELKKNTSKYFTLAGFMIDADNILDIEIGLKDIKLKYGLEPSHEIKWHTTYSNYGLNYEQYEQMRFDIVNLISKYNQSVIGIIMDKESCYKKKSYIDDPDDLYAVALHLLMERCCMESTKNDKKNPKPTIMIADSRQSINNNRLDKQVKIAYRRAKNMGTHFVKFASFAESIIFVDSDDFPGIQIADYCAGIIHKKYEKEDEKYFEKLLHAIVKKDDNIYGPGIKFYK